MGVITLVGQCRLRVNCPCFDTDTFYLIVDGIQGMMPMIVTTVEPKGWGLSHHLRIGVSILMIMATHTGE